MSAKLENYQHLGETMIKKFASRGMEAFYCATSADAVKKVRKLIPEGSSVTWGGSATLSETGILDALQKGPYGCIDRSSAKTPEEARALYGRIVCADYFLTSTNAFTSEGELVNVDGNGNRVACLIAGPSHVIVVAGMNKLTGSVEEAISRIRHTRRSSQLRAAESQDPLRLLRTLRGLPVPGLHLLPGRGDPPLPASGTDHRHPGGRRTWFLTLLSSQGVNGI